MDWAAGQLRTTFSADRGFGVVAAKPLQAGQFVAQGALEKDFEEPCYAVLGGGTMYGPAALVNAACTERCANAIFCVPWLWERKYSSTIQRVDSACAERQTGEV